ncbi:hypothetical protein BDQ12DRAFT_665977 [Crucibulum laeve]|uniref:Uncharacterized protein n=1 Tax=Crucibulum laeve TaxID=68775 RepID=A0A5C3M2Z4_9AGAR|nr:hypothetical protein BDQ12DRAFT_665977 [Crucibulum laeve]
MLQRSTSSTPDLNQKTLRHYAEAQVVTPVCEFIKSDECIEDCARNWAGVLLDWEKLLADKAYAPSLHELYQFRALERAVGWKRKYYVQAFKAFDERREESEKKLESESCKTISYRCIQYVQNDAMHWEAKLIRHNKIGKGGWEKDSDHKSLRWKEENLKSEKKQGDEEELYVNETEFENDVDYGDDGEKAREGQQRCLANSERGANSPQNHDEAAVVVSLGYVSLEACGGVGGIRDRRRRWRVGLVQYGRNKVDKMKSDSKGWPVHILTPPDPIELTPLSTSTLASLSASVARTNGRVNDSLRCFGIALGELGVNIGEWALLGDGSSASAAAMALGDGGLVGIGLGEEVRLDGDKTGELVVKERPDGLVLLAVEGPVGDDNEDDRAEGEKEEGNKGAEDRENEDGGVVFTPERDLEGDVGCKNPFPLCWLELLSPDRGRSVSFLDNDPFSLPSPEELEIEPEPFFDATLLLDTMLSFDPDSATGTPKQEVDALGLGTGDARGEAFGEWFSDGEGEPLGERLGEGRGKSCASSSSWMGDDRGLEGPEE